MTKYSFPHDQRADAPEVQAFIRLLYECPDRARCPELVRDKAGDLLTAGDEDTSEIGRMFFGKAVADLAPDAECWNRRLILPRLSGEIILMSYYLPSLLEQALVGLSPFNDLYSIMTKFAVPRDTKKRGATEHFLFNVCNTPPWYRHCLARLFQLVVINQQYFESDEIEIALKCIDQPWVKHAMSYRSPVDHNDL